MIWRRLKSLLYIVLDLFAWWALIFTAVTDYRTGGWKAVLTPMAGGMLVLVVALTVVAVLNIRAERHWRATARRDRPGAIQLD